MTTPAEAVRAASEGDRFVVALGGRWRIDQADRLDRRLRGLAPGAAKRVLIDLDNVEALDTAGAWVVYRTVKRLREEGYAVEFTRARPEHKALLDLVESNDWPVECRPPREPPVRAFVAHVGSATLDIIAETGMLIGFLGATTITLFRSLLMPWRVRWTALVNHMEQVGLNAVPIVGLISFLVGAVLAYQGAEQLRRFGAEIFVVNLVGVSVLREMGILLTAIIVAGRSGSAFTAAIGSMKVREEIDAMRTLGLDPMELLVMPRLIALVLTLPLLAFFADVTGLLGGGLVAWMALGIGPAQFIERLGEAVPIWSFWVGIIKAPVFAFVIAVIGCYEGFRVEGSAESVGRMTTRAVVEAIFLVIVIDALFSVLFAFLEI
ncbi:MAG: MlaE family lipid ABC transporter permease subunit [Proteobacteria bacterium]|nr:MlaE family lipid ABC transporter permease subunit [Pseudomonadota bacterium]